MQQAAEVVQQAEQQAEQQAVQQAAEQEVVVAEHVRLLAFAAVTVLGADLMDDLLVVEQVEVEELEVVELEVVELEEVELEEVELEVEVEELEVVAGVDAHRRCQARFQQIHNRHHRRRHYCRRHCHWHPFARLRRYVAPRSQTVLVHQRTRVPSHHCSPIHARVPAVHQMQYVSLGVLASNYYRGLHRDRGCSFRASGLIE